MGATSFRSSITSSGILMLMVAIGRSGRSRRSMRSIFVFIGSPFLARCLPRRDDANHSRFPDNVHDKEMSPVLSKSKNRLPRFILGGRIQKLDQRIDKYLAGLLEPDSVLGKIEVRLLHIPAKSLACVEEIGVHALMYIKRIYACQLECFGNA